MLTQIIMKVTLVIVLKLTLIILVKLTQMITMISQIDFLKSLTTCEKSIVTLNITIVITNNIMFDGQNNFSRFHLLFYYILHTVVCYDFIYKLQSHSPSLPV